MPAVVVPDLKRKFALLRSAPAPRTWPELAAPFGTSYKSLQFWQDGSSTRDPDRMPDWAVPIFTGLIAAALPGEPSPDEVRQFVFGPAATLEEEVRTGASVSLLRLIDREARRDTATLIRRGPSIELVEVETGTEEPCPRLALGEWFRIAFRRLLPSGYVLALQHAQQAWALLPATLEPALVLVPGIDDRGEPRFMHERRDPGRHLFICVETADPPPATLKALLRDEIAVDKRGLDALAAFYGGQPAGRRACHVRELAFETADPA